MQVQLWGWYNSLMKKKKIVIWAIVVIAVALLLEASILKFFNDRNAYRMSNVLLDRVITVLEKNDTRKEELIESLKDEYIIRAKAVAYIVDAKPEVENDVKELQKIARLLSIDEIHLIDEEGSIYSGSLPKYFGLNFDSGEQMSYFKPMLSDKNLSMCQDVTPNTAEGKNMMYAITWNDDKTKMIQVGIAPTRLLNEMRQNKISTVVADMPVYKGMEILVADVDTRNVYGATDTDKIGMNLDELGLYPDEISANGHVAKHINVDGHHYRCLMTKDNNYMVIVRIESLFYWQGSIFAIVLVGIYLVIASCFMFYMAAKAMQEKFEKEKLLYTSNTDELTRCYNRHAYENDVNKLELDDEWIYMSMDLNGLKRVNDSFGHMAGDELICGAAECMKNTFNDFGNVYRIGGDEFVVLITNNTNEFDTMLKDFDNKVLNWHGEFVDSMTISYGYVFSSEKKWEKIHDISKAADKRMYEDKARYYRENGIDRRIN